MKNTFALSLIFSLAAGGLLVFTTQPAEANYKNGVNKRQYRQERRLYNGTANGALTGRESWRLQQQQQKLAAKEARFRHSGRGLTPNEAARLNAQQNALSKNIYNQKHDGQTHP